MEAIAHAGTVLGVLAKDGVVLAAEKKVTGKLLDLSASKEGGYGGSGEKIFLLNSCVQIILYIFILIPSILFDGLKKCHQRCCRSHGRCKFAHKLRADSSPTAFTLLQRRYPSRTLGAKTL